jgi:hypothetical protein
MNQSIVIQIGQIIKRTHPSASTSHPKINLDHQKLVDKSDAAIALMATNKDPHQVKKGGTITQRTRMTSNRPKMNLGH